MRSHTNRFFIVIALIACSSSIIIPMDPPKLPIAKVETTKQDLKWIHLLKNILLDHMTLGTDSGEAALEDQFISLNDGNDSFKNLDNRSQESIITLLKIYMSSSNQVNEEPITLGLTVPIFRELSKQDPHIRNVFFDTAFCHQLIRCLAKKFNESEIVIAETMKFGASHQIVITQNQLYCLCYEKDYSEKEFEKQLHQLIKRDNVDVNFTYFGLKTPLMVVVSTDNPSFARPLIKAGANPFMKDKNGKTAKDILDEYWPNPLQTLEMPLEYRIALKALMGKNNN